MKLLERLTDGLCIGAAKVLGPLSYGIAKVDDHLKERTGKGLTDRMIENEKKEEKLKEEKPALWALKKLSIGTLKGIIGASYSKD